MIEMLWFLAIDKNFEQILTKYRPENKAISVFKVLHQHSGTPKIVFNFMIEIVWFLAIDKEFGEILTKYTPEIFIN